MSSLLRLIRKNEKMAATIGLRNQLITTCRELKEQGSLRTRAPARPEPCRSCLLTGVNPIL